MRFTYTVHCYKIAMHFQCKSFHLSAEGQREHRKSMSQDLKEPGTKASLSRRAGVGMRVERSNLGSSLPSFLVSTIMT